MTFVIDAICPEFLCDVRTRQDARYYGQRTCTFRSARLWASNSPVASSATAHARHVKALGGGRARDDLGLLPRRGVRPFLAAAPLLRFPLA